MADDDGSEASTAPDFITKMRRVLDLYDHSPADGRVICADEATLSELARRLVRRQGAIDSVKDTSVTVDFVAEYFATQDTPEWYEADGRLLAYS